MNEARLVCLVELIVKLCSGKKIGDAMVHVVKGWVGGRSGLEMQMQKYNCFGDCGDGQIWFEHE